MATPRTLLVLVRKLKNNIMKPTSEHTEPQPPERSCRCVQSNTVNHKSHAKIILTMKNTPSRGSRWLASLNTTVLLLALTFGAATSARAATFTWTHLSSGNAGGSWATQAN